MIGIENAQSIKMRLENLLHVYINIFNSLLLRIFAAWAMDFNPQPWKRGKDCFRNIIEYIF